MKQSARTRSPRNKIPSAMIGLILAGALTVLVAFVISNNKSLPASVDAESRNWRQEIGNLILDSCTDCQLEEIIWQENKYAIIAEIKRQVNCPSVTVGRRFYTLGVKSSLAAEVEGRMVTIPPASAFQSCNVKWTVQKIAAPPVV